MDSKKRGTFSNKMGFILAAAGSAVGLGNLWRFPYLAAKYGGGIFLLIYLILAVTFGFTLMITEIAIGRKTKISAIGAFKALDKRFAFIGYLGSVVPFIIVPYYCVIGGWVAKYLFEFTTGSVSQIADSSFFGDYITQTGGPLFWFILYVLMNMVVVLAGVQKGIEKASKILMPALIVLTIAICIFSLSRPGAIEGLKFYLLPDFKRFSGTTLLAAMGQLFYSLSLAMGIMITYGSYLKSEDHLEQSVRMIEIFDTSIAFLAGLMIIPSVFAFSGGEEAALEKGPSLMFIILPKVFDNMKFGGIVGTVFFLLVLFAALTSSISLMETTVSIIRDKFHLKRQSATIISAILIILIGGFVSLGYGLWSFITPFGMQLLDFFDFISNSILMPIVALLTCIFIGYIVKPKTVIDEVEINGRFKAKKYYIVMVKYLSPIILVAILIFSILESLGIIKV